MARVPIATVIALLRQRDVEATADLHEGSRQATHQGQGVGIPGAVDDGGGAALRGAQRCFDGGPSSSRDSSTVAGVPELSMRASLNSSFARRSMPSSSARAWDSVVLPEPWPSPNEYEALHGLHSARSTPAPNILTWRQERACVAVVVCSLGSLARWRGSPSVKLRWMWSRPITRNSCRCCSVARVMLSTGSGRVRLMPSRPTRSCFSTAVQPRSCGSSATSAMPSRRQP